MHFQLTYSSEIQNEHYLMLTEICHLKFIKYGI